MLKSDAGAAVGIASNIRIGKAQLIEACQQWYHEKIPNSDIKAVKVTAEENLADAFTKYFTRKALLNFIGRAVHHLCRRNELAPATES